MLISLTFAQTNSGANPGTNSGTQSGTQSGTNPGKVTGIVKDSAAALSDATVSIRRLPDSSVLKSIRSDAKGNFSFDKLAAGRYMLTIAHVGYHVWDSQPFEITPSHSSISIIDIMLRASGIVLQAATVVGTRPLIENKIDKTVMNVDASPSNGGLNALEVLEKAPGVTVDNDGNISLKGKAGVVILIDGKQTYLGASDLANLLKNMPANQLDQVEIMSQPPAKYDASGNSGLINLTTKKNKANGFNGSLTTSAIIARYFKNTNNLTFNWRQGKINLYGSYGYVYWDGFNDIHIENSLRENGDAAFNRYTLQHTYGRYSDRGQSFRLGMDVFASKQTNLGFSVNGTVDNESFTSSSLANFYDSLHQFVQYNSANSQNRQPQTHLGFNGNFLHKLDDKGSEISVDADYIFYNTPGTDYSNNYLYDANGHPSEPPYLLNGVLPSHIDIYSLKSDYKKVLNKTTTFEAGIKSSYVTNDNDAAYTYFDDGKQTWLPDTSISNHFVYKENINAAYVNWQQQISRFSMQLGLRAEQTNSSGDQTVKSLSFVKHYLELFPTAYFTYKVDESNTFGISYGRRIQRPPYQSLNPFRFQLDRYTYQEGNPNLQPQFSNNIEASYNYKGQVNVTANYTMTTDIISEVLITTREPGDSNYTTYQTTQNVASQRNIGLAVNYTRQIGKSWTLNAFLNVYNNHYLGVIDSTNIDVNYTSFNASFNSQYRFKKGWVAELSGFYNAKDFISGAILADGRGMFSLGGSKQVLNGKGSVKLNLRDPFYLMSFTSHTDLSKAVTHTHSLWDNRRIILTLVYRFGKTANNQQSSRKSDGASDEQSRVGGGRQQ